MPDNRTTCGSSRSADRSSDARADPGAFQCLAGIASGTHILVRLPHAFIDISLGGARADAF
jgi:hypothetical protein